MNCPVGAPAIVLTRETILVHARKLPAAAQVLAGLCELLEDANTDLDRIAEEIRLEPTLAARVIRISNSPVFGGGQRVGSVDEAVNRVGFGEVLRLVGAATVAGLVDRSLGCYGISAERLREAMLFHGLASEALAVRAGVDRRSAYSGGLLRAIGIMVVDRAARIRVSPADVYEPAQYSCYGEWEMAKFGLTNGEAAALILDEWRFPADLVSALQHHLEPGEDRFATVLNLAGAILDERGFSLPGDAAFWKRTPEKLAAAGIDEAQYESAAEDALAIFERQRTALF
jgi:HD-like signal output (HDOD) protein